MKRISISIGRIAPRSSSDREPLATRWPAGRPAPRAVTKRNCQKRRRGEGRREQERHVETERGEQRQSDGGHDHLRQPGHQVVDPRCLAAARRRREATDHRMAAGVERGPARAVDDAHREQRDPARDQVRGAADGQRDRACRQHAAGAPLVDEAAHPRPQNHRRQAERGHHETDHRFVAAAVDDEQRQDRLDQELRRESQEADHAHCDERTCEERGHDSRLGLRWRAVGGDLPLAGTSAMTQPTLAGAASRAAIISNATASIMSSWPPTTLRRPSSTSRSRASTSYRDAARSACRRKLE